MSPHNADLILGSVIAILLISVSYLLGYWKGLKDGTKIMIQFERKMKEIEDDYRLRKEHHVTSEHVSLSPTSPTTGAFPHERI